MNLQTPRGWAKSMAHFAPLMFREELSLSGHADQSEISEGRSGDECDAGQESRYRGQ